MRTCYEDISNNKKDTFSSNSCDYAVLLHERFSADKMYEKFIDSFYEDNDVTDEEIESLFASLAD